MTGPGHSMGPVPTDGQLLAQSMTDPEIFGVVFDRHARPVGRFLARRALGDVSAEDLLAETFMTAFQIRSRFDPTRTDARPWLFGIASNTMRRSVRDESRRWKALAHAEALDPDHRPARFEDLVVDRVDAARVGPALASALARMRDDDRAALLLLAWGDLTYAEIAEALDIPIGTVRSRIHRARRRLRAALSAHGVHTGSHELFTVLGESS